MNCILKLFLGLLLGIGMAGTATFAQTDGSAKMEVTINDYTGASGTAHFTVAWVTTEAGAFIKSLRKQGPGWTSGEWANHCGTWNTARANSQVLDGYSSATAANYTGTNSPVILTWNCRNASNVLMPDGNYKFWVQYAENSGQGPYTTTGLLWTKGPAARTNSYANQGVNFSNMKVTWSPAASAVAPSITSAAPTASGTVGVPYNFTCTASGTAPITFTASGLPTGLAISSAGAISGTPSAKGTFSGAITAANGTLPNATQAFSINVNVVPTTIASIRLNGSNLILSGTGPANGKYAVLTSTNVNGGNWTSISTNTIGPAGTFSVTNAITAGVPQRFYKLRIP